MGVNIDRDEDEARLIKNLIKMMGEEIDDPCAYCGAFAAHDEHVVPYSYLIPYIKHGRRQNYKSFRRYIVRACASCNLTCSNKVFKNFWEKKKHIAERLRLKYKKLLASPDWTEEELRDLDGRLRTHVYQGEYNKSFIRLRIENLEKPEVIGEPYEDRTTATVSA